MVEFRINNLEQLKKKLTKLPKKMEKAIEQATYELVERTQTLAIERIQSSTKYSNGELASSLQTEVVVNENGEVLGRVWSASEHALYREFGTGPVGKDSPKELPANVTPVYSTKKWFIPVNLVSVDLEAVYGVPRITIKGQDFYMTKGQPARPFLYPSLKDIEEQAPEIFKKEVHKELG